MSADQLSGAGLVQQTVQIVASHDLTLFVMRLRGGIKATEAQTVAIIAGIIRRGNANVAAQIALRLACLSYSSGKLPSQPKSEISVLPTVRTPYPRARNAEHATHQKELVMDMIYTSAFWIALTQIIVINILLSGDNAVVIALASRSLPRAQQKQAILFGSAGSIVLRVTLTLFAVMLLDIPYLKLIGGALLLWIGASMLAPDDGDPDLDAHSHLWAAIRTIIVADLLMSLDNIMAVAAAAKGNIVILILGLGISIPVVIVISQLLLNLMARFPIIVTGGAGLLGWVAGELFVTDKSIGNWIEANARYLDTLVPVVCAVIVVVAGKWMAGRGGSWGRGGRIGGR